MLVRPERSGSARLLVRPERGRSAGLLVRPIRRRIVRLLVRPERSWPGRLLVRPIGSGSGGLLIRLIGLRSPALMIRVVHRRIAGDTARDLSGAVQPFQHGQEILRFADNVHQHDGGERNGLDRLTPVENMVQLADKFLRLLKGGAEQSLGLLDQLGARGRFLGRQTVLKQPVGRRLRGGKHLLPLVQQLNVVVLQIGNDRFDHFRMLRFLLLPEADFFQNAYRQIRPVNEQHPVNLPLL
ncbi:hypothetical protein PAMA110636_17510 [Paenibacillus macerans]